MKKHRPVKHAHRKAIIAQRKAKGKYSKVHLPNSYTCHYICIQKNCKGCWASIHRTNCLMPCGRHTNYFTVTFDW